MGVQIGFPPPIEGRALKVRFHGHAGRLLYLDFDGALHPKCCLWGPSGPYLHEAAGHSLFEHVRLLHAILREHPTICLVLNSAWTEKLGLNEALARLPAPLRRRVVGTTSEGLTPLHAFLHLSRAERILLDVELRKPAGWVALDSEGEEWPEWAMAHIVQTHPVEGISPVVVQAALHSKLLSISAPSRKG